MRVGEFEEGAQFGVGGAPFWKVGLILDRDGHAFHPGRFGGDEAVEGVFEGEAVKGIDGECPGAVHIHLWMWFAIGQVFGGGYCFEGVFDAQFIYNDVDQGEGRGGGQADMEAAGPEKFDDRFYPRHRRGILFYLFDDVLMQGGFGGGYSFLADAKM